MCSDSKHVAMGFTDEAFPIGTHMCFIYNKKEEHYDLISKYLKAGLKAGEKAVCLLDTTPPEVFKEWLSKQGIRDVENEYGNQLEILNSVETYCPKGKFDPDGMLEQVRNFYLQSKEEGYPNIRTCAEMSWAVKGIPGSERLAEYEAKVNGLVSAFPFTAMCQYNANDFDGATILNILKVHPFMIVHGQIVQNPYYLSPEEFLKS